MPYYQAQGRIPKKRHTVFRKKDGSLHFEELMGREGFSGAYSNLYHLQMPTEICRVGAFSSWVPEAAQEKHQPHHLKTFQIPSSGDPLSSRRCLLFNDDLRIYKVHPTLSQEYFYRNAHFDELIYVQSGAGRLETQFGVFDFKPGDYLIVPRGVISRMTLDQTSNPTRLLLIESARPIRLPRRYVNDSGQLQEHAPFSERDLRFPELQPPVKQEGEFQIQVRLREGLQEYFYRTHPFDVVGWAGTHYPWAFNINDFDPIVGKIHQPPSVHQTFEAEGFVVCSFVTRPFDFHPDAIPAPYPHSNVDSEEILFYSDGDFMSRTGISAESLTYHPMGLPHGPHPGKYEASIGKKETLEKAVMIDTFQPLHLSSDAIAIDDPDYPLSWMGARP